MVNAATFVLLAGGGLLLPGWLLSRLLPSDNRVLSSFLGSATILFFLVLGLDGLGLPISIASLRLGLALIIALLLVLGLRAKPPARPEAQSSRFFPSGWRDLGWAIPVALGLATIATRAIVSPLSGLDNPFRWDFLARQMLRLGRLDFYPPVTADDFDHYGWFDGIPPLISVLNLWTYVSVGKILIVATAARVILEGGLLFYGVGRLARQYAGPKAGWPAAAALATSALALWGVAMGQETGWTAITLVALCVFLEEYRQTGQPGALIWAGVAAALGALSREYGLAWIFFGLGILYWQKNLQRGWRVFSGTALALALPWYARNLLHTGNPLFAQSLGGLFPSPPLYAEMMVLIKSFYANSGISPLTWSRVHFLAASAGIPLVIGAIGCFFLRRRAVPLLGLGLAVTLLWLWSVQQTAGGFSYSTRVLTPAIALSAVLAGVALARLGPRASLVGMLLSVLVAAEAGIRSLYLPLFLPGLAWDQPPQFWFTSGAFKPLEPERQFFAQVSAAAHGGGIVIDALDCYAFLVEQGANAVPMHSPRTAAMFSETLSPSQILTDLRQAKIRFLLLSANSEVFVQLGKRHPFLHWLETQPTVYRDQKYKLYDLPVLIASVPLGQPAIKSAPEPASTVTPR